MRAIAAIGLAAAVLAGCGDAKTETVEASGLRLEKVWRTAGFAEPESVSISADKKILYVTNVSGKPDGADGQGFISTVDAETGKIIDREWVSGLDAPKGVSRIGAKLYVADIDDIVVVDLLTAQIEQRHPVEGAVFLNDVAALSDGTILVSDSRAGRIHQLMDGVVSLFIEGPDLAGVNGIYAGDRRHLIVATTKGKLFDLDRFERTLTLLAEGVEEGDGVMPAGKGRYFVTAWPGVMRVVEGDGSSTILLDTREAGRFMNDGLRVEDMIYQPHLQPGELTAYRVTQISPSTK